MIKKLLAAVLIWGCGFGNAANAQWQTIFQDSVNYWFTSVYFINNDTGFVGGFDQHPTYGGTIFRTLDGGQTWDTTFEYMFIMSLQFLNDSVGYAGGQDGNVYKTTDMGANWSWMGSGGCCDDVPGLYFLNDSTGYKSGFSGEIYKTTTSGFTWQPVFYSVGQAYFPGTGELVFVDSLTGYSVMGAHGQQGFGKTISKTSDGGLTWIDLGIPTNFYPYSCYFFDSLSGFSVGYPGKITHTNDGGATWSNPDSLFPYPLYDIAFVNDSIGYIVGGSNQLEYLPYPRKGIILKTIDRGNSWNVVDSNYYDSLTELHFPSDSVGYAVGMNGIILKIINANSVSSSVQIVSPNHNSISISPNPATDKITISFAVTASENITIKIYSITGEVVFAEDKLSESFKTFGKLNATKTIDVKDFSNGIYFLSVQADGEVMTMKIVVQH